MSAKKWNKDQTIALIQQYEKFPELWNVTLLEYRNKELKISKIKEIAENLGISEKEITRKWHNLRSQMCAEARKLKKKKSGSGAEEVCFKSNWEFYDALQFMVGYSAPQDETSANLVSKSSISNHCIFLNSAQSNQANRQTM